MKRLLIILIFCPLISFSQSVDFPVIKNISDEESKYFEADEIRTAFKPIFFIGQPSDSLDIQGSYYSLNSFENFVNSESFTNTYRNTSLTIIVDTTQVIISEVGKWKKDRIEYEYYRRYPILIQSSQDSVMIGFGHTTSMILEAQNEDGNWQKIEEPFVYMCGTGLYYIMLFKGQVALTSGIIYKGNFRTKLRYKLGNSYSNEFYGTINKEQFYYKGRN